MLFHDQKVSKSRNRRISQTGVQFMISCLWRQEMEVGKIGQVWLRKKVRMVNYPKISSHRICQCSENFESSNLSTPRKFRFPDFQVNFYNIIKFRFSGIDGTSRNDNSKCKHDSTKLLLEDSFSWPPASTFICWTNRHVINGLNCPSLLAQ